MKYMLLILVCLVGCTQAVEIDPDKKASMQQIMQELDQDFRFDTPQIELENGQGTLTIGLRNTNEQQATYTISSDCLKKTQIKIPSNQIEVLQLSIKQKTQEPVTLCELFIASSHADSFREQFYLISN